MEDVKSVWPLCDGLQTCYNGYYKELRKSDLELNFKNNHSSDCSLKLGSMKSESLVIVN